MKKLYKVVIPFKGPEDTKNRLSYERSANGILFPDERRVLSDSLIRDLYGVWRDGIGDKGEVVVGIANDNDNTVSSRYKELGINVVKMPYTDINPSLTYLAREAQSNGYDQFIVSGSDLPLITQDDIRYLFETFDSLNPTNGRVLFSVGNRGGTTVYVISPPTAYEIDLYSLGESNVEHQLKRLQQQRIPFTAVTDRINLFLDMDYPEDLVNIYQRMLLRPEIYSRRETYQYLKPLVEKIKTENTERGDRVRELFERFEY